MSNDIGSGYSFAQLREDLKNEELPALSQAGLLSEDTIDYLHRYRRHYEPEDDSEPYYARNTEHWEEVVVPEVSKNLRKAVRNGNQSVVKHAIGLADSGRGAEMDFVDYEKHRALIREPGLVELMFAGMGGGKTMTAARQAELWMMLYPNGDVFTNIRSWAEIHPRVEYVRNFPELDRAAKENSEKHILFVGDEMGIDGNAYGGNEAMEQVMHEFTRLMRKEPFNLRMILISQRPTDIHPTLRNDEIAVYAMKEGSTKKEKQKQIVIYDETTDKSCTEVDEDSVRCSLDGIGIPDVAPDTNDKASWDWGSKEKWAELGYYELEDGGSGGGKEARPCEGVKDDGESCGSLTKHESGFCRHHRDQAGG